ncbi:hypothetical protein [Desulfuribacillus alkaliarsenatis]|uniref:Cthe-2314-like HEPN domain-containing protein n=1 Tax=Desulfuribacillus alkaliarsenatis TaxID=766136 RepID=A0A1E5G519_9FIRM|nr:hypothetical protein [Desulfuribacillus alkaliarsenatis]OEF98271.1 hypothetical protein BHF68_00890 [Desulfuribacillus alkaliarsenatis]
MAYIYSNGISSSVLDKSQGFYLAKLMKDYSYPGDEIIYSLDNECVRLYEIFQNKIFEDSSKYYQELKVLPIWVYTAGLDSDISVGKKEFERLINSIKKDSVYKHLYLADCQSLIGSVQENILSINWGLINFYIQLSNTEHIESTSDGVFWKKSMQTSLVFSILSNLIITIYSSFDLLTKTAIELESIHTEFKNYPNLKSSNKLYGNKKELNKIDFTGTVFDSSETIQFVINMRNELIHNSSWEQNPKIFFVIKDGKVQEKFILKPDFTEGNIDKYKNRKRFFSSDIKINLELPNIILDILNRIKKTICEFQRL